jgi:TonB family protein
MIDQFLTYELKVAVLIAVFYIFWRLLVANETWHRLNRIVLIATAIASFVLPFCVITIQKTVEIEPIRVVDKPELVITEIGSTNDLGSVDEPSQAFNWQQVLMLIYIIGVVLLVVRMLISIWRLHRMMAHSELYPLAHGRRIAVCDKVQQPFSWWNTVFMNRKDFEEGATALLTHELGHIRLHHSADVVLVELLTALQWFNPTMWMLRADLHTIHEYEADQQVLSHGFNDIQYLTLLIRKAAHQSGYSLANGIANQSTLKKRITMIMKPQSNRWQWLRLAYLLPIVGVTIALNAETVTNMVYKNDEPQKQVPVKKGKRNATIKTNANQGIQVIEVTEVPEAADKEKTYETTVNLGTEPNVAVLILNTKKKGEEPLLIVDGKIATIDQVRALPRDAVASVGTMREIAAMKSYGEKAKNGALIITTVKHQKEIDNELASHPDVFDKVAEAPQFPGGMAGMMQYLSSNIRYPEDAKEAGAQGRVIVSFIIEKDGSISNAKVAKSTYSSLDDEALRVVSAMPKWIPGKQNGEAVRVKYSVPVSFRLNGKEAPKPEGTVMSVPVLSPEEKAVIDENGRITINGRELKRRLFDGSHLDDNKVGLAIVNIMLNDIEHFDYEIDGKPVAAKDFVEVRQKDFSPIKSMEYIPKDSEHPKDRLLITTKEK